MANTPAGHRKERRLLGIFLVVTLLGSLGLIVHAVDVVYLNPPRAGGITDVLYSRAPLPNEKLSMRLLPWVLGGAQIAAWIAFMKHRHRLAMTVALVAIGLTMSWL